MSFTLNSQDVDIELIPNRYRSKLKLFGPKKMQIQECIILSSYSKKILNVNGTQFLKEPENEPEKDGTVERNIEK